MSKRNPPFFDARSPLNRVSDSAILFLDDVSSFDTKKKRTDDGLGTDCASQQQNPPPLLPAENRTYLGTLRHLAGQLSYS
jgi:hypothetical protein